MISAQRLLALVILSFFTLALNAEVITGKVYAIATTKDGKSVENPAENIAVTDGFTFVYTDVDGRYSLNCSPKASFISIVKPDSYLGDTLYRKLQKGQQSYDFMLAEGKKSLLPSIEFAVLNFSDSSRINVAHLNEILIGRGINLAVSVGKSPSNIDSLQIPLLRSSRTESGSPLCVASTYKGVQLIVLSKSKSGDVIGTIAEILKHTPKGTPSIIINNDIVTLKNEAIYYKKDSLHLKGLNVRAIVEGGWNINYVDNRGRFSTSRYSTTDYSKGGNDRSPASFAIFKFTPRGEISTEEIYPNIRPFVAVVFPQDSLFAENGRIRVYANAYSSTSKVVKVKAGLSADGQQHSFADLNQATTWSWSGFSMIPSSIATSMNLRVVATFENGETVTADRNVFLLPSRPLINVKADTRTGNIGSVVMDSTKKVLKQLWTVNAQGVSLFTPLMVEDSLVFAAVQRGSLTSQTTISAFDLRAGRSLWHYHLKGVVAGRMAYSDGVLAAIDQLGNVVGLDYRTGLPKWSLHLSDDGLLGYSNFGIAKSGILYAIVGHSLTAVDLKSGHIIWSSKMEYRPSLVKDIMAIGESVLVIATESNGLVGFDLKKGSVQWKCQDARLQKRVASIFYSSGIFNCTSNNSYFQLREADGSIIKSLSLPLDVDISSATLLDKMELLCGTTARGVYNLDLSTGKVLWHVEPGLAMLKTSPYAIDSDRSVISSTILNGPFIALGGADGVLYIVEKKSGRIFQKIEMGAPIFSSKLTAGNLLVTIDFSGNISLFEFQF